jgi:pilus assembly protein TadC
MENLAPLALVFTTTAIVALLLLSFVTMFQRDTSRTLKPASRVLGPLTGPVGALLPISGEAKENIRKDLLRAGHLEPAAPQNFLAVRSLLTYIPLLAGLIPAVLLEGNIAIGFFIVGIVGGVLGFAVPRVILSMQADERQEAVRRGLPMLMDTLGLNLSTGASLPEALETSGAALQRGHPALSEEVRVVTAHSRMRGLAHALDSWKKRMPLPELGSLVFLLSQSDRMGTDATKGLWELSSSMQVNSRQRAEAAANRTSFYMIFPTVLCLMVAAALLMVGPGVAQLMESQKEMNTIMQESEQQRKVIEKGQKLSDYLPNRPSSATTTPLAPGTRN